MSKETKTAQEQARFELLLESVRERKPQLIGLLLEVLCRSMEHLATLNPEDHLSAQYDVILIKDLIEKA